MNEENKLDVLITLLLLVLALARSSTGQTIFMWLANISTTIICRLLDVEIYSLCSEVSLAAAWTSRATEWGAASLISRSSQLRRRLPTTRRGTCHDSHQRPISRATMDINTLFNVKVRPRILRSGNPRFLADLYTGQGRAHNRRYRSHLLQSPPSLFLTPPPP